jgi:hypothetical protein
VPPRSDRVVVRVRSRLESVTFTVKVVVRSTGSSCSKYRMTIEPAVDVQPQE